MILTVLELTSKYYSHVQPSSRHIEFLHAVATSDRCGTSFIECTNLKTALGKVVDEILMPVDLSHLWTGPSFSQPMAKGAQLTRKYLGR